MKRTSKKLKATFITIAIIIFLIVGGLAYFFIYNQAPILKGEVIYDVVYKNDLELDVYLPTSQVYEKSPVVVYFHGGAWVTGRKEVINANRINQAVNDLRSEGFAFVCPDYTLATREQSPFPACIVDAVDAVNWVAANAEKYNFDAKNIGIAGESAGAHIAMMVAYAYAGVYSDSLKPSVNISYVIDLYGPSDLEKLYNSQIVEKVTARLEKLPDPLRERLDITQQIFGFDPENDSAKAQQLIETYSPVNYITGNSLPTLIIHGTGDQIVPVEQADDLKHRLDSLHVENEYLKLEGVKHAFRGIDDDQKQHVQQIFYTFVKKHYQTIEN